MSYGYKMLKGESDYKTIDGRQWYLVGNSKTKEHAEKIAEKVRIIHPDGMHYARIIKKKTHYSVYGR